MQLKGTCGGRDNIILACTHFLKIEDNTFIIKEVKNSKR